jgi:serine-type D-Ala-D-Ala carboxypeptidase/endopeptidase
MLSRRKFLSAALAAAAESRFARGAASCPAPAGYAIRQPTTGEITQIVERNLPAVNGRIGAAVGVASPEFGAQILCFGSLLDQSGNPMPFSPDTPFEIASITKTFTATVYAALLQSGQVQRSDTLAKYLGSQAPHAPVPQPPAEVLDIPLFDLADYTSGLPADDENGDNTGDDVTYPTSLDEYNNYTEQDMFNFLASSQFTTNVPPPEMVSMYTYSNLGFSLLAIALQAAAGADNFGDLIGSEILLPLGMSETQVYGSSLSALLPQGFDQKGIQQPTGWQRFPAYYGAGGLVSTPNDMMTWLQFNMGMVASQSLGGVLPVVQSQAAPKVSPTLGLGWFLDGRKQSGLELNVIQKNGDLAGFCSQMVLVAPDGCSTSPAGVFALVNYHYDAPANSSSPPSPATQIAYDLLFALKDRQPSADKSRYSRNRRPN